MQFTQFLRALQREVTVTDTATRPDGGDIVHLSLTANNRPYFRSLVTFHDETVSGTLRLGIVTKADTTEATLQEALGNDAERLPNATIRLTLAGDIAENPPADPETHWYPHIEFDEATPNEVLDVLHAIESSPLTLTR